MRQKNPFVLLLAGCGFCLLIIIDMLITGGSWFAKSSPMITGTMNMVNNPPEFLKDIQVHDYVAASKLIDAQARQTYTAGRIQRIEEDVEKRLGRLKSIPATFTTQDYSTNPNPKDPQMPIVEYYYTFDIRYEKGTATAVFRFRYSNIYNPSGMISDFEIENVQGSNNQ